MTFPATPNDIRTEFHIDGSWVAVSGDVYNRDPVIITVGQQSEGTRSDPGSCTLTLNNKDGKYSPRNPRSPYFGRLGQNTPMRVSVPGYTSYLQMPPDYSGTATTPDTASLDLTGDMDLAVEADTDWYAPGSHMLLAKWDAASADRSYNFRFGDGLLKLAFANPTVGQTFTVTLPPGIPSRAAVRVTYDANDGSGNQAYSFYWAASLDGPWTLISSGTRSGLFTIGNSSAPLSIAPADLTQQNDPRYPVVGRVYRAQVRNGIAGTLVADPDFRSLADGATSFTDSTGKTWTVNGGAEVRDREDRFFGEVTAWPPRWDVSGSDVYTTIQASGILRRLGQGQKALASTLRRRLPSFKPLAYWPMEEGQTATRAYSPIKGVRPLRTTGFRFDQADSLPSSAPLPVLDSSHGAPTLVASVPTPTPLPAGNWYVSQVYRIDTQNTTKRTILRVLSTGRIQEWRLQQSATGSQLTGYDGNGTAVVDTAIGTGTDLYGQWIHLALYVYLDAGALSWFVYWTDVGGDAGSVGGTVSGGGSLGWPVSIVSPSDGFSADLDGMAVGHLSAWSDQSLLPWTNAITAWSGETAADRMGRLSDEESVPLRVVGFPDDSLQVGPQYQESFLDLVTSAAEADSGLLTEDRSSTALVYRTRADLYSQAPALTLDYTAPGEVPPPFEPVDDDSALRNDVTVTRLGGSSGRAVLESGPLSAAPYPDGVGRYDESVTMNLYADEQTDDVANWRLHLGTWDEARYPQIHVNLATAPAKINDVLKLRLGDKVVVTNPPAWLPPDAISQHVRGYTETLTLTTWDLTLNCTPARPWDIAVADDRTYARAESNGTALTASVNETDTLLTVAVSSGPQWTADPAEFPLNILVDGELMTVSRVMGAVNDDYNRTVSSGWGTSDTGQAWTTSGGSAGDFSVKGV